MKTGILAACLITLALGAVPAHAQVSNVDLSITKVGRDPVKAGTQFTYTVRVDNAGPSDALNVQVTDTLPAGVTFVSTTGCAEDPNGVPTCSLGPIAAGASEQYGITVTVDSSTTAPMITNSATVSSDTPDSDPLNNTATLDTVVVVEADLTVTKLPDKFNVFAGQTLTYTVAVTNRGPSDALNVQLSDPLPAGLTLGSTSGCPNDPVGVPTCSLGNMVANERREIIITATVDSDVPHLTDLTNIATVSSDTPEPADPMFPNTASQLITVRTRADLAIAKADSPDPVVAGQTLTYTVTVTNAGPSDALNVQVSDTLPAGVSFVSTTGCTNDPTGVATCSLGTIAGGGSASYTIAVTVDPSTTGTITNSARVSSDTPDPNGHDNADAEDTTVTVPPAVCLLIIDEDTIDNDISTILAAAALHGVTSDFLTNDDIPTEGPNPDLRWNDLFGTAGDIVKLPGGQRDDEGLFALPPPPAIQYADSRTTGLSYNEWIEAFVAGTLPQDALDKVQDVMPLRNQDLVDLVGRTCVAVVYDSNISINFQPLNANLQGARYGLFTFTVLAVEVPGSIPESQSSTSLYDLWVEVEAPLDGGTPLQTPLVDHPPDTVQITTAKQATDDTLTIRADSDFADTAFATVSIDGPDAGTDPGVDPFELETVMTFIVDKRYEFVTNTTTDLTGRRVSVQTDEGGNYNAIITASALDGGDGELMTESPGPSPQGKLDVTIVGNVIRVWVGDTITDPVLGVLEPEKHARILDAIAEMNEGLDRKKLDITLTEVFEEAEADIKVFFRLDSPAGGMAEGVIAFAERDGPESIIYMIAGWNWFDLTDEELILSDEYDWQTVVLHELGHAIGMDHSNNPNSAMYFFLETGETRRELHQTDLSKLQVGIN